MVPREIGVLSGPRASVYIYGQEPGLNSRGFQSLSWLVPNLGHQIISAPNIDSQPLIYFLKFLRSGVPQDLKDEPGCHQKGYIGVTAENVNTLISVSDFNSLPLLYFLFPNKAIGRCLNPPLLPPKKLQNKVSNFVRHARKFQSVFYEIYTLSNRLNFVKSELYQRCQSMLTTLGSN